MFTRAWFDAALNRAIRTLAQAAIAAIGAAALIENVNWATVASTAGLAAILSLLTSVSGLPEVDPRTETERLADELADADRRSIVAALDYDPRVVPGPDADGHVRWTEPDTKGRHEA